MATAPTYFPAGSSAMVVGVGESAQPVAAALARIAPELGRSSSSSPMRSALGKVDDARRRRDREARVCTADQARRDRARVSRGRFGEGRRHHLRGAGPGDDGVHARTWQDPRREPESEAGGRRRRARRDAERGEHDDRREWVPAAGEGDITYQRSADWRASLAMAALHDSRTSRFYKNGHPISDTPGALRRARHARARPPTIAPRNEATRSGPARGASITVARPHRRRRASGCWALIAGADDELRHRRAGRTTRRCRGALTARKRRADGGRHLPLGREPGADEPLRRRGRLARRRAQRERRS